MTTRVNSLGFTLPGKRCADVVTDGWSPVSGHVPVLNPRHKMVPKHRRPILLPENQDPLPWGAACTGTPAHRDRRCPKHNPGSYSVRWSRHVDHAARAAIR